MTTWFNFSSWIKHFPNIYNKVMKDTWDAQLKKTIIMYNCKGLGLQDIRKVFQITAEGELALKKVVDDNKWKELSIDKRIISIAKYVNNRLRYVNDKSLYGKVEYWDDPYNTWLLKKSDCEGSACLIAYLGWLSDIPHYRLKVVAGYVDDGKYTEGGHAFVLFLREEDNQWYVIEGSYKPNAAFERYKNHKGFNQAYDYKEIWWWTTDKESGSKQPLIIKRGLK